MIGPIGRGDGNRVRQGRAGGKSLNHRLGIVGGVGPAPVQLGQLPGLVEAADPGDLPVVDTESFLSINLMTAEAIDLEISDSILQQAEIIRRSREVGFESVRATCLGFWQSVSDHWGRSVLHRKWDWSQLRSIFDQSMGMILLMFGRRPS